MAKILSLRLNYKGKFLDYAKEGKEIRKQFFIGSNKHLQWQILDPAFPDKHLFVKEVGNALVMNIPAGAALVCEKDGKPLDSSYLKQNKLLSGNELILDPSVKGKVNVHKDWDVDFEYREPWVAVLTNEQRQIVADCSRRAAADPVTKFNRTVLLLATFLAIVLMIVFDLYFKKEQSFDASVEDRLLSMSAQKVEAEFTEPASSSIEAPEAPETPAPEAKATTGQGGAGKSSGAAGISGMLGGFDPSSTRAPAEYAIVTTVEGFAVRGKGGGGGGTGIGGAGAGAGSAGTSFSTSAGPGFSSGVGAIATSGPATAGYAVRPEGGTGTHITGDARGVTKSGRSWEQSKRDIATQQDFKKRNITTVKETGVGQLDADTQARYSSLGQQVRDRQSQIEAAYRQAQLNQAMSFKVTLYVSSNGTVSAADLVPLGEYPASFVSDVKRIIESWRFNVQQEMSYEFRFRFNP